MVAKNNNIVYNPKDYRPFSLGLQIISISLIVLYPYLGYLVLAIVFYALILSKICVEAVIFYYHQSNNIELAIGCLIFAISDIFVLINVINPAFPKIGLILYWVSLWLIDT